MHAVSSRNESASGQAMIEFAVGLIVLLALLAGLLELTSLTKRHTDLMVEARKDAGNHALGDVAPAYPAGNAPEYIRDWCIGPANSDPDGDGIPGDEKRYTADDVFDRAVAADFSSRIVERTGANAGDWAILDQIPNQTVSRLRGSSEPSTLFGLVRGEAREDVDLLPDYPLTRKLLFHPADDQVHLSSEVWMTWTKGLY
jgi:hypothetical protein